jgi:WD40 repeat protein
MLNRQIAVTLAAATVLCTYASAQGTKQWTQSRYEEFEKGNPQGIAIRSDGFIEPGPRIHEVLTTPSTYIWSVASDRNGDAFVGTGSPATVLKVSQGGKSTKLFESKDITVQVVRVGPDGDVYAATLPSGKVYSIKPGASPANDDSAKLIFDPAQTDLKPKYIWDMTFDPEGRLYVATGGPAAIYRMNPAQAGSKPEMFFQSDEQSIRCLAFDPDGSLIAGSDGTGLVYRIGKDGKGFVIYDAPKHEITAVAIGSHGTLYAAAVGEKNRSSLPPLPVQGNVAITATITFVQPGSVQAFNGNTLIPDGSEIYELNAEGAPRKLWAGHDDIVYALRSTPEGLLAATGNRGRIYRIQESGDAADIAHLEASQAIGFADAPQGLYVGTSNTGKLFSLSNAADPDATYTSDVFDAGVFSRWGRAEVDADAGAKFDLYARSGNVENPLRAWGDWQKVTPNNGPIGIPAARFVQWKTVLHSKGAINAVGLSYLPVNVAPVVDEIAVQPGARVNPTSQQPPQPQQVSIVFANMPAPQSFPENAPTAPLTATRDKTAVTVRWAAHDDNGDDLVFAIYFRGDAESTWRLLKDKITDRFYSFDSALLPDGRYQLKVVASDAPSHNPGEALTDDKVSDIFLLDTTAPVISGLQAKIENGGVHTTVDAKDSASPIAHAEYSIDAGPWQYVEPVGKLSDSTEEHYDFSVPLKSQADAAAKSGGEHVVTVRVYDRFDNVGTAKTVVPGSH